MVTPGRKPLDELESRLAELDLPDLRGKTVLDVGAWDGFFSFAAERLGAKRVVALDHYVWARDYGDGAGAAPSREWPGRRGFELAREALGSRVEAVAGDFMTIDLERLGTFDVVLYLKVLYHMEDPLRALRRVRAVTRELAVIETKGAELPALGEVPLCRFFPTDELDGDPTNWWSPNWRALDGMVRAAGFSRVDMKGPLADRPEAPLTRWRAVVHARR